MFNCWLRVVASVLAANWKQLGWQLKFSKNCLTNTAVFLEFYFLYLSVFFLFLKFRLVLILSSIFWSVFVFPDASVVMFFPNVCNFDRTKLRVRQSVNGSYLVFDQGESSSRTALNSSLMSPLFFQFKGFHSCLKVFDTSRTLTFSKIFFGFWPFFVFFVVLLLSLINDMCHWQFLGIFTSN